MLTSFSSPARDAVTPWIVVGAVWITLAITFGLYFSFPVFFVALVEEFGWSIGNGVGGAVGPWFGGAIHDVTGSYRVAFLITIVFCALGSACFWLARPPRQS